MGNTDEAKLAAENFGTLIEMVTAKKRKIFI